MRAGRGRIRGWWGGCRLGDCEYCVGWRLTGEWKPYSDVHIRIHLHFVQNTTFCSMCVEALDLNIRSWVH